MNKEPQVLYGVFSEGMDSYLRELPREDCPYPSGSAERVAWLRGWDQTAHGKRYSFRHGERWFNIEATLLRHHRQSPRQHHHRHHHHLRKPAGSVVDYSNAAWRY